jgi:hypothetical protein
MASNPSWWVSLLVTYGFEQGPVFFNVIYHGLLAFNSSR